MNHEIKYLNCGKLLKEKVKNEIDEIVHVVKLIKWEKEFKVIKKDKKTKKNKTILHQEAYNNRFEKEFLKLGWEKNPFLSRDPRLIGDFGKNLVFGEIQFGNSATLYRDFYKFQYGHRNGLVSMCVLIVPVNPQEFFPTRSEKSITNMAEYDLALRYFTILPISTPTMIIGLIRG